MKVVSVHAGGTAECMPADQDSTRLIDILLLEKPPTPGDWLLVHLNMALRVMDENEAFQINDALQAVAAAAAGEPFEHLLGDLTGREPILPSQLQEPSSQLQTEPLASDKGKSRES